jgi:hypothetical protein
MRNMQVKVPAGTADTFLAATMTVEVGDYV